MTNSDERLQEESLPSTVKINDWLRLSHLSRELGDDDLCKYSMTIILWRVRDVNNLLEEVQNVRRHSFCSDTVISILWPAQDARIENYGKCSWNN
jgi:hypothetical protein